MSDYPPKSLPNSRGVTLYSLKDVLYSLNMGLVLAMQHHNEEAQEDIQVQIAAVQAEISRMCFGSGLRR